MVSLQQWLDAAAPDSLIKAWTPLGGSTRNEELVLFKAPSSRSPRWALRIGDTAPCDDGVYLSICGQWRVTIEASVVIGVGPAEDIDEWDRWYKARPGQLW